MRWAVLVVALAALASGHAQAQAPVVTDSPAAVPTTLFFHLVNVQDFVINTQEPPAHWREESAFPQQTTLTCADLPGSIADVGVAKQAFHTLYGYHSPSLVEYDDATQGVPRMFPARGLAANATLEPGAGLVLHWYLLASPHPRQDIPSPMVPQVTVRATVRAGDDISVGDVAYDSGRLLLQGQAGPATLVADRVLPGDGMRGEVVPAQVDGQWVYEFRIPLDVADPVLPQEGFNVRIDTFLEAEACARPGAMVMPPLTAAYSSAGFRPRMEVTVRDLWAGPTWVGLDVREDGRVLPRVGTGTVFGAYDVSMLDVRLTRHGPTGPEDVPLDTVQAQGYGPCGHDCGHAMETQYVVADPEPRPGVYNLSVSFTNLQGTARQTVSAQVTIEPAQASPAPAAAVLLLGVGALVAMRRH